ncbi:MAG: type II toxin-antitoxin system CcdA family antitoxin, partial [Kosmotogaceae bacterium]
MAKKRTTITVEEELLDFAHYLGLNLSGFLEERLKDLRAALTEKNDAG